MILVFLLTWGTVVRCLTIQEPLVNNVEEDISDNQPSGSSVLQGEAKEDEDGYKDYKDYTGWRILRIFAPTISVLEKTCSILRTNGDTLLLEIFRAELAVDVALPPFISLESALALTDHLKLCCLDDGIATDAPLNTAKISEMCSRWRKAGYEAEFVKRRGEQKSDHFLGWRTVESSLAPGPTRQLNGTEPLSWDDFYRYGSIIKFGKELAMQYPTVEWIEIGRSVEGRPLFALVFAAKPSNLIKKYKRTVLKLRRQWDNKGGNFTIPGHGKARKKKKNAKTFIFIEAGVHAREWISPAVATYLAQQLADAGKEFLKRVSVILVPMANPDGYEFSHTTDRMWRKNRRNSTNSSCKGVDLNRNWGKAWGDPGGSSGDPCSPVYRGSSSFSEPETLALRDLALTWIDKTTMFLTLHSYGKFILRPWSHSLKPSPNDKELERVAKKMKKYLRRNGYPNFKQGRTGSLLYKAAGTAEDYMLNAGVKYSYTLELPYYSFIINPSSILPISGAVWNTLVCTIGLVARDKRVREFCKKRIVKIMLKNGQTVSEWFEKDVPLDEAEKILSARHNVSDLLHVKSRREKYRMEG